MCREEGRCLELVQDRAWFGICIGCAAPGLSAGRRFQRQKFVEHNGLFSYHLATLPIECSFQFKINVHSKQKGGK
jgi:hypothetical protein